MSSDSPLQRGAIRLRGVTKEYDRAGRKSWSTAVPWGTPRLRQPLGAIQGIDLDVQPGEALGVIGPNGAGKSTLLKLLAGVVNPSAGTVQCTGRIGSMIELGLGFHPELTGRENARVTATILGLSPADADALMPEIIEFAGIEDAMDTPIKHYSTGMRARLGFAVAIQVNADVLLIDEVLAVGDSEFQIRCLRRIAVLHDKGTTLVFVSHATWLVADVCDRVVQVREGRIVDDGPGADVIQRYLSPEPGQLDLAEEPAMRFHSFAVHKSRVKPFEHLRLDAEVLVTEETIAPEIALELTWATMAPDMPFARICTPLPRELEHPGSYRITGRSSALPIDSGHATVRVSLVDVANQRVLDRDHADVWIDGPITRQRPELAADVMCSLTRVGSPSTAMQSAPGTNTASEQITKPSVESTRSGVRVPVAECVHVTKRFHAGLRRGSLRSAMPGRPASDDESGHLLALDAVDFDLGPGVCLGIVGPNGSGKSTLLKALAGVIAPTSGEVITRGRLVSMLELGIGFHPDLSGMENLQQTAGLLDLPAPDLADIVPQILEFAGIGDAVNAPVKQYSSGMRTRLGLALAVHCKPDLLLIDEALAVGDRSFQEKAVREIRRLVAEGAAAIFVSHDIGLVEELCQRVIRLEKGRIADDGPTSEVIDRIGGFGWDGGVVQITSPVRVHNMVLHPRHLHEDQRLDFEAIVEVFEPCPNVRIEFSYLAPTDDPSAMTEEQIAASTLMSRTVVPTGALTDIGRYQLKGHVPQTILLGTLLVVLTAVDERDGVVTAKTWQMLKVGTRISDSVLKLRLEVDWHMSEDIDTTRSVANST